MNITYELAIPDTLDPIENPIGHLHRGPLGPFGRAHSTDLSVTAQLGDRDYQMDLHVPLTQQPPRTLHHWYVRSIRAT